MQLDDLGIDYIERRSGMIDAVTLADARRVARRLLDPGLLITVAGRPKGVTSTDEIGVEAASGQLPRPRQAPAGREP
jgi:zinc protease